MYDLAVNRTISLSGHLSNIDEMSWKLLALCSVKCTCITSFPEFSTSSPTLISPQFYM